VKKPDDLKKWGLLYEFYLIKIGYEVLLCGLTKRNIYTWRI